MSHWSSLGLLALVAVSILPWVMLRRGGTWAREAVDGHLIGAVLAASILLGACRILAFIGDSLGTGLVTPGHAAAAAVPLSALALAWISRAKPWPGEAAPTAPRRVAGPRWSVADRAALALGALAFLWLSLLLLVTGPSGYEAHAYVIPLGAHFAQTRSLAIWDSAYMHTYPADTSVITALLLQAGLKGLIAVQQLPFLILLIATLYAYCKRLCTDGRIALRMSLGAAFVPVIGVLGMTGYPDIQGVAFATIAVYFVLFRIDGPIPWPIVGGLSGSLAFNAKSLHAVPIAIAAIIIALRGVLERLRLQAGHSPRAWITDLVLFSGFVLLGSSYWLVRNYSEFGNPLYPVPVPLLSSLLGWPGSPGFIANQLERAVPTEREWVSQSWQWVLYPWQEGHYIGQNIKESSGLGLWFAVTVPPAVVVTVASLVRLLPPPVLPRQARPVFWWTFALACLVLLAWWLLRDRQPRYALLAIVLLTVVAAACYRQARGATRLLMTLLVYLSLAVTGFIVVSFKTIDIARLLSERGTRAMLMSYPEALDRLPAGATVINLLGRPANFIALGQQYTSRVISAPYARDMLFHSAGDTIRIGPSAARWFQGDAVFMLINPKEADAVSCMVTETVDERLTNPFNGLALEHPVVLLRVIDVTACPHVSTDPRR